MKYRKKDIAIIYDGEFDTDTVSVSDNSCFLIGAIIAMLYYGYRLH